jgi:hypothetical protein
MGIGTGDIDSLAPSAACQGQKVDLGILARYSTCCRERDLLEAGGHLTRTEGGGGGGFKGGRQPPSNSSIKEFVRTALALSSCQLPLFATANSIIESRSRLQFQLAVRMGCYHGRPGSEHVRANGTSDAQNDTASRRSPHSPSEISSRGSPGATPERHQKGYQRRAIARLAAEIKELRANFAAANANANANANKVACSMTSPRGPCPPPGSEGRFVQPPAFIHTAHTQHVL